MLIVMHYKVTKCHMLGSELYILAETLPNEPFVCMNNENIFCLWDINREDLIISVEFRLLIIIFEFFKCQVLVVTSLVTTF